MNQPVSYVSDVDGVAVNDPNELLITPRRVVFFGRMHVVMELPWRCVVLLWIFLLDCVLESSAEEGKCGD